MLLGNYSSMPFEAGCDEAGRGCLAGPVTAAAVILPPAYQNSSLNDSKQLSASMRQRLRGEIERDALAFAVAWVSPSEIDRINILNASIAAMHLAVAQLRIKPAYLLIDGNRFKPYKDIPHSCMVKGDARFLSIAAASILAKTYRDEYMQGLHPDYPAYGWLQNKGYPTLAHRNAIARHGLTEHHRKTFHHPDLFSGQTV